MGFVLSIANFFAGGKIKILLGAVAALAGAVAATVPAGPVHQAAQWILGLLAGLGILSGGTENLQPAGVRAAVRELDAAKPSADPNASAGYDPTRVP